MANIRRALIENRLGRLYQTVGVKHAPVDVLTLFNLHDKGDFRGMVAVIKKQMRLSFPVRVCYVNDPTYGPQTSTAWVNDLQYVPLFGTQNENGKMPSLYLRRESLEEMPPAALVFAIAHELSHILLTALRSELNTDEEATDLLAILLGYGMFYAAGKIYGQDAEMPISFLVGRVTNISGYLSHEEIIYAASLLHM